MGYRFLFSDRSSQDNSTKGDRVQRHKLHSLNSRKNVDMMNAICAVGTDLYSNERHGHVLTMSSFCNKISEIKAIIGRSATYTFISCSFYANSALLFTPPPSLYLFVFLA